MVYKYAKSQFPASQASIKQHFEKERTEIKMTRAAESPENGWLSFLKLQPRKSGQKAAAGSRPMSKRDQGSGESQYGTAVAAAAFAIHSLEEPRTKPYGQLVQPHSKEVPRRPSYKETKSTSDRPARSSSFRSKLGGDPLEKIQRHEKLKSVISWANGKKIKANESEQHQDAKGTRRKR